MEGVAICTGEHFSPAVPLQTTRWPLSVMSYRLQMFFSFSFVLVVGSSDHFTDSDF